MTEYRSREGDVTALDTRTELTTLGSETSPGVLQVPAGMKRIVQVIVAIGVLRITATTAAGAVMFVRIEPDVGTKHAIMVGGAGGFTTTSGSEAFSFPVQVIPVDINIEGARTIVYAAEMAGADLGTVTVGVTLVFQ